MRALCLEFLAGDADAQAWVDGEPEDFSDAPDCDVMADRFTAFAQTHGLPAETVKVEMFAPHDAFGGGPHYFTVIDGVAVDWTARQFYDVRGVFLDASEIPSPLLFLWPGQYPVPTLGATADA